MKTVNKDGTTESPHIERELEFSTFYRLHHWVRVISILVLIVTGLYLANPFIAPSVTAEPDNFMYALFRSWHVIFGFVAISMFIGKTYYFFFVKSDRAEINSVRDLFCMENWSKQIGYYMLVTRHPKLTGAYNVVQFLAYTAFYFMMVGLIITGLILYAHVYHQGLGGMLYEPARYLESMVGGLAVVRDMHHLLMWGVILFVVVHVYMAVFNAVYGKEGSVDSIISGYKWHDKNNEHKKKYKCGEK